MSLNIFRRSFIQSFAVVWLLVAAAVSGHAQWGDPVIEALTATGTQKSTSLESLEIDSDGFLHVVWVSAREAEGWWINYRTNRPNGIWEETEIVNTSEQFAYAPVLAVSPFNDEPVIIFETQSWLVLARRTGGVWTQEYVANTDEFECCPTVDIDEFDVVHIAWIAVNPISAQYKIAYAAVSPIEWMIQVLEDSELGNFGTGAYPRVAVNSIGVPHITYRAGDYQSYRVDHAWSDAPQGGNWLYETLGTPNLEDFSSDIAVTGSEDLHVAIAGNDGWGFPTRIYYAAKPELEPWQPMELTTGGNSATYPSLAIDGNGTPHIASMGLSGNILTGQILYSVRSGPAAWSTTLLIGEDHFNPCLKLDYASYGHLICYTGGNTGNYDVYHVRSQNPLAEVPFIEVTPDTLNFGNVIVGSDSTATLTIQNSGTADLIIDELIASMYFSTETAVPITVIPNTEAYIQVTFSPLQEQFVNGVLEIRHNAPQQVTSVPLVGTGAAVPEPALDIHPDSLYFGEVLVGGTAALTCSLRNTGTADLEISLITAPPCFQTDFTETVIIAPGTEELLGVTFAPAQPYFYEGALEIESNEAGSPHLLPVTGLGIELGAEEAPAAEAREFALSTHPNPFNPSTLIRFNLPREDHVRLSVYNVNGQVVSTLTDGVFAAGSHEVKFDASSLPSGLYFARLESFRHIAVHKLMLVK